MLKIDYIVNSFFDSMTWLLSETEVSGHFRPYGLPYI